MRKSVMISGAVLLALALGACSSSGGSSPKSKSGETASKTDSSLQLIAIGPGPLSTEYWDLFNNGAQAASKDLNVSTKYLGPAADDTDPNAVRQLILDAIVQHPQGLLINDSLPASVTPAIKEAVAKKIPVILTDLSANQVKVTGALGFVGPNGAENAMIGGQRMTADGCKDVLIVNEIKGAAAFSDQRTAGFLLGYKGKTVSASIPISDFGDSNATAGIISTLLLKNSAIDCAFSVGGAFAPALVAALHSLGSRGSSITAATIDTDQQIFTEIKDHELQFAVDSQPWSEGFLAVTAMVNYLREGQVPAADIGTGPAVVDQGNVDTFLKYSGKAQ